MNLNYNKRNKAILNKFNAFLGIPDEKIEQQKPKRGNSGLSGLYFKRLASPKYIKNAHNGKRPQAVFKVVSFARGYQVKNLIAYLTRVNQEEEKQVDAEDENGVLHHSSLADAEVYNDWKKDFVRKKKANSKRPPRHAMHLLFSAAGANTPENARKTLNAARKTAEECFREKGYKYALILHTDTQHPHVHVVVNMKNINDEQKKLKLNKPEIFEIRYKFAENLNQQDLYHIATLKHDRPAFVVKAINGKAVVMEKNNWFASKLKTRSSNFENLEAKKNVSRAVFKFRKKLKKETREAGTGKKSTLDIVRNLEKSLLAPKNIEKEVDKAVKMIGQDARRFKKYLDEFKTARTSEKKKNSYAVMKKMRENIYKSIDIAEDVVKTTPFKDKKKILEALGLHKKLMQGKIRLKEVEPIEKDFLNAVEKYKKYEEAVENKPKEANFAKEFLRRKEFERVQKEHLKTVEMFRKEILVSNAPMQDKNKALTLIKNYQKAMNKKIGQGIGW